MLAAVEPGAHGRPFALPLVRLALTEDLGGGDVTTDGVVDETASGRAHIEARHEGVLAGSEIAALTFQVVAIKPECLRVLAGDDRGTSRAIVKHR